MLRAVGDLTENDAQARCLEAVSARRILGELEKSRRAVRMRIGGEERWIAAEDAGLYRDALGAVPPGGLPAVFLEDVEEPLERLTRRYARTHGPFTTREISRPLRRRPGRRAARARALRPADPRRAAARAAASASGATRTCCGGCGGPRSPRSARRWSPPSSARSRASCPPGRESTARRPAAPGSTACASSSCRSRASRSRPRCGSGTSCRGGSGAYSPAWLDQLCASGELVWVGAGALGRRSGRVALLFREDARWLGAPPFKGERPAEPLHDTIRERLGRGAAFWTDLLADLAEAEPAELQEALWDLVWAGEITNDAFAPLRAPRLTLAAPRARRAARAGRRRDASPGAGDRRARRCRAAGRSPRGCSRAPPRTARACARSPRCCSSATGSSRARPSSPRG